MHLIEGDASIVATADLRSPETEDAHMIRFPKTHRARGLLPCAATILSLTLAATLKIERSCSQESYPAPPAPSVFYPYAEIASAPKLVPARDSLWRTVYRHESARFIQQ